MSLPRVSVILGKPRKGKALTRYTWEQFVKQGTLQAPQELLMAELYSTSWSKGRKHEMKQYSRSHESCAKPWVQNQREARCPLAATGIQRTPSHHLCLHRGAGR